MNKILKDKINTGIEGQGVEKSQKPNKRHTVIRLSDYGILFGLIVLIAFFSITSRAFFSFSNLLTIIRQMSIIAIIAVGEAVVLIGGGIDASIGSVAGKQ